jgi:hypothetical protein
VLEPRVWSVLIALGGLAWFLHRAGGRMAPRLAIAPAVYLFTRWPVLLAWGIGTAGWLWILVPQMEAKGEDAFGLAVGISVLCGGGFGLMVVGPIFFVARLLSPPPAVPLEEGETTLLARPANHFLGGEGRGGTLLITSRRLAFRPHRFNVQLSSWTVPLEAVDRTEAHGDRLLVVHTGASEPAWIVALKPAALGDYLQRLAAAPEATRGAIERPSG